MNIGELPQPHPATRDGLPLACFWDTERETIQIKVDEAITQFGQWLDRVTKGGKTLPYELELLSVPRGMGLSPRSPEKIEFPPILPAMESLLDFTRVVFDRFQIADNPAETKTILCFACHFLEAFRTVGEGKKVVKAKRFEETTDHYLVYTSESFINFPQPGVNTDFYFDPGRHRFACRMQSKSSPGKIFATVRFDTFVNKKTGQAKIDADFEIKEEKAPNKFVDLVDKVFGAKKHHRSIASGDHEECFGLIENMLDGLKLGCLYIAAKDLPSRSQS